MPKIFFTSQAQFGSFKSRLLCFETLPSEPPNFVSENESGEEVHEMVGVGKFKIRLEDYLKLKEEASPERMRKAITTVVNSRQIKGLPPKEVPLEALRMQRAIHEVLNSKMRKTDKLELPEEEKVN